MIIEYIDVWFRLLIEYNQNVVLTPARMRTISTGHKEEEEEKNLLFCIILFHHHQVWCLLWHQPTTTAETAVGAAAEKSLLKTSKCYHCCRLLVVNKLPNTDPQYASARVLVVHCSPPLAWEREIRGTSAIKNVWPPTLDILNSRYIMLSLILGCDQRKEPKKILNPWHYGQCQRHHVWCHYWKRKKAQHLRYCF